MAYIDLMRVVELAFSTVKTDNYTRHIIIATNDDGERDQVTIYSNTGKELIRSVNGKRISKEA